ncbi:MAG: hypothetical protein AAFS10_25165 [Myxococcota bacterium]
MSRGSARDVVGRACRGLVCGVALLAGGCAAEARHNAVELATAADATADEVAEKYTNAQLHRLNECISQERAADRPWSETDRIFCMGACGDATQIRNAFSVLVAAQKAVYAAVKAQGRLSFAEWFAMGEGVAQALAEGMTLVSSDRQFARYDTLDLIAV